jgi:hypothetical protein
VTGFGLLGSLDAAMTLLPRSKAMIADPSASAVPIQTQVDRRA